MHEIKFISKIEMHLSTLRSNKEIVSGSHIQARKIQKAFSRLCFKCRETDYLKFKSFIIGK